MSKVLKRSWSEVSEAESGSDEFAGEELGTLHYNHSIWHYDQKEKRVEQRLNSLKIRLERYSSRSMALLRAWVRRSGNQTVLGICGMAVAKWCKADNPIYSVTDLLSEDYGEPNPVDTSDRVLLIEYLVASLYKATFADVDDERFVILELASKAGLPSFEFDEHDEPNRITWQEACWKGGVMLVLLQRIIRGALSSSNTAKDIFEDDEETTYRGDRLSLLHLNRAFSALWERCLQEKEDSADRRRTISKVYSSLTKYFRAFIAKKEQSSRNYGSPYDAWNQQTVDIIEMVRVFLPTFIDLLCRESDTYRALREVVNWVLCPTDESVTGLLPLLNVPAVDADSLPQRSLSFLLDRPDILDPLTKLRWLQGMMKGAGEDSAVAVQLLVHREAPLQDLCEQLGVAGFGRETRRLTSGVKIRFEGEPGQDEGGLWREYLPIAFRHLMDSRTGLFVSSSETNDSNGALVRVCEPRWAAAAAVPDAAERNALYELFGILSGMALLYHAPTSVHLSQAFVSAAFGIKNSGGQGTLEVQERLAQVRAAALEGNLQTWELTFSQDDAELGETWDLRPEGRAQIVRNEDAEEYCRLYSDFKLQRQFDHMMPAFHRGLAKLVPDAALTKFAAMCSYAELDAILAGDAICIDDWRRHTEYEGIEADDELVDWFWDTLASFTPLERQDLWEFCSGSKGLPPGGFARLTDIDGDIVRFKIVVVEGSADRLPVAHTCSFQLDLASGYSSESQLKEKLLLSVSLARSGFGIA